MKDKIEVRDSPIHGKGLFAKRRLRRDELVGIYEGVPTEENDTYVLWFENEDGQLVGIDGRNELRFSNHSRNANAILYGDELYALQDIEPGMEIKIDYGEDWADVE
jgi:SET domain-containing protein